MKTQIFVSYCHADIKADDQRLKVFIEELQSAGKGTYEIIVDYLHEDASIGKNLDEFMQKINSADAAIILLTKGYREKTGTAETSGVYYEFRRIYDRWKEAEENGTYGKTFLVLPIIFTGSFSDSCPKELTRLICGDLTWLYTIPPEKKNRSILRSSIKNQLKSFITDISSRIAAVSATKTKLFDDEQKVLYEKFLFEDTKSRWNLKENHKYLNTAFVKTSSFDQARKGEINFLVGRKGSGKSTILHVLPIDSKTPFVHVLDILFEDVPYQATYNLLIDILKKNPAEASDLRNFYGPIQSYELLWDVFFHLYSAWKLIDKLPQGSTIVSRLRKITNKRKRSDLIDDNSNVTGVLFLYTFEMLISFSKQIVSKPNTEAPLASMYSDFTISHFRDYVLTANGFQELQRIYSKYIYSGEKILVTADGFDVMTGYFARKSSENPQANILITELLLSLFQIVMDGGPLRTSSSWFYKVAHFCIAIPYDIFSDVRSFDRDRYQYRHKFGQINWSGIELSALVRKRLVLLRNVPDPKNKQTGERIPLQDRLDLVMSKGYPELPNEIAFQFGSAHYRMPLFIYVLRHTFWRPRDILFYYSVILAAAKRLKLKGNTIESGFIRQAIAGATRYIIEDEFIEEFSLAFKNIKQVLKAFNMSPQVLTWEDLNQRIGNIKFDVNVPEVEVTTLEWKVKYLFNLGILGVVMDRKTSDRMPAYRHAFKFNENDLLSHKLGKELYPEQRYALHPALVEYLHLDTTDNPELILPLDWDYLDDNEIKRDIFPPFGDD